MNIILYSTNCPKCKILEKKLNLTNLHYVVNTDVEAMQSLGFTEAPMLVVDNRIMNFVKACDWINNFKEQRNGN